MPTPPGMNCSVLLLDGTTFTCTVDKSAKGRDLFDRVCQHLQLHETDYFACSYKDDKNIRFWLDNDKKIHKQIARSDGVFNFEVKFYPPEPSILNQELSRYQLFLQLRQDVACGKLPCSFVTHALLGSYAVQSQFGDYDVTEHGVGIHYINSIQFAPQQSEELLDRIVELHHTHCGMSPSEAELNYLQNAKKLAMYGVDLHFAKDNDGADVEVGVNASGLLLYKDRLRINRFTWAKIIKFSYKWNVFSIKIRPGEFDSNTGRLDFKLPSDRMAKRLWKIAVEHHTFFRLRAPESSGRSLLSLFGPKCHYSGRTLHQVQQASLPASAAGTLNRPTPSGSLASARRYGGGSKSMETVMVGSSTERSELYTPDLTKRNATLDLKGRRQPGVGSGTDSLTRGCYTPDMQGNNTSYLHAVPAAGDRTGLWPGDSPRVGSSPYSTVTGTYSSRGQPAQDADVRYPEGYGTGARYGSATGWPGPQGVANYPAPAGSDRLLPNQEDQLRERGNRSYGPSGQGSWHYDGTGATVNSLARSYVAPDGSMVAEYHRQNNGLTEHQYGNGYYDNADDFDHDKALTEAILAVTAMNTDLSVEKIEIVHKTNIIE